MFVEYEVVLDRPYPDVCRLFMAGREGWAEMGNVAYRRGEELRGRVGPAGPIAKEVIVTVGRPHLSRHRLSVPVSWRATGATALFPRLDGELQVEPGPADGARLVFRASYRPPLGAVGDLLDRVALARLARSTIADWVDRVAESLDATRIEAGA